MHLDFAKAKRHLQRKKGEKKGGRTGVRGLLPRVNEHEDLLLVPPLIHDLVVANLVHELVLFEGTIDGDTDEGLRERARAVLYTRTRGKVSFITKGGGLVRKRPACEGTDGTLHTDAAQGNGK